jgi:hypothetical protein
MAADATETSEVVFPLNVVLPFDATPEEHAACQERLQHVLNSAFDAVEGLGGVVADRLYLLEDYLKHDRVRWREETDCFVFESVTVLVSRRVYQWDAPSASPARNPVAGWIQLAKDTWQAGLDKIPGAKRFLILVGPPVLFLSIREWYRYHS